MVFRERIEPRVERALKPSIIGQYGIGRFEDRQTGIVVALCATVLDREERRVEASFDARSRAKLSIPMCQSDVTN